MTFIRKQIVVIILTLPLPVVAWEECFWDGRKRKVKFAGKVRN